ncbi:MAG: hypothetical protein IK016_04270 [Lachnospiraceae bacterium]|nr:hypothetical protein [Lachnospiraceae bacterium]
MKRNIAAYLLFALIFGTALLLCSMISWSDGDDAFFLQETATRSLPEFVSWRYQTWSGRIFAEASIWLTFRFGLAWWRVVNALMLTALPYLMCRLVSGPCSRRSEKEGERAWLFLLTSAGCYLLMSLRLLGYSCVWITGSLNYLHGAVFATAALIPLKDALDSVPAVKKTEVSQGTEGGKGVRRLQIAAVFFAAFGAGFAEQIAAILAVLLVLGTIVCFRQNIDARRFVLASAVCAVAVLILSLAAPGNALRNETSEGWYFPGFSQLTLAQRLLIGAQYVLSAFSNELSLLFALLAAAVAVLALRQHAAHIRGKIVICVISVFALLATAGAIYCRDMGLTLSVMAEGQSTALSWEQLTPAVRFTILLWGILLVAFFISLCRVFPGEPLPLLLFLAAVAAAAVMAFSPTIYASGERALFPSAWMLWLLLLFVFARLPEGKIRLYYAGALLAAGLLQAALSTGIVLSALPG